MRGLPIVRARPLAEEGRHASERHLAQPPRLVTPELDEAALAGGGSGRLSAGPGRPRKGG